MRKRMVPLVTILLGIFLPNLVARKSVGFTSTPMVPLQGFISGLKSGIQRRAVKRDSTSNNLTTKLYSRKPLIGGNWKSNVCSETTPKLVSVLNSKLKPLTHKPIDVVVVPPSLYIDRVRENIIPEVKVAAQDVAYHRGYGAYTGEMSADMLSDFGLEWCLVGHSERREGFGIPGETNELVASKCKNAVSCGLNTIVCIGEKLQDRDNERTAVVINNQLKALAEVLDENDWEGIVIAYEPVWAIGTGRTATPFQAQNIHHEIREWVKSKIGTRAGDMCRIIYGGSVKASNAAELIQQPDIDGFLVGGASLSDEFATIVSHVAENI